MTSGKIKGKQARNSFFLGNVSPAVGLENEPEKI
jgi:hypothetical protein